MCGFISGLSILFHCSIFLSLCLHHTVLMAAALQYSLKSGRLIPPVPNFFLKIALAIRGFLCFHANCKIICFSSVKNTISSFVRKHLTRGFLYAVLDLSGTLWPLLIPEYSGIKRRDTPFPPDWRIQAFLITVISTLFLLMKRWLFATLSLIGIVLHFVKSGILIFIFAENSHLVKQYICPCHGD